MSKSTTTKLIYKPDSQKTDEYILFVNPEEVSDHHLFRLISALTDDFAV
jgi:hypothetical protein